MEKRQYQRFLFRQAVEYSQTELNPLNGSLGKDISQGGVQIRVQQFLPLRSIVNLKIHLTNPSRTVPVKGLVVWVREVPESEVFDIGIQFMELDRTDMSLESYIRFQGLREDNQSS